MNLPIENSIDRQNEREHEIIINRRTLLQFRRVYGKMH